MRRANITRNLRIPRTRVCRTVPRLAILADTGYCSEENLAHLESSEHPERKIEGYIATGKQKHDERRAPCKRGPLPKGTTRVERMRRKLQTKVGKAIYAARKCVVEPVFGQIKQARGFRQPS
jgi:Transposase DDE domain